jgi:hypothetical protein
MKSNFIHQNYYLWSVALVIPLWAFIIYKKKKSRVEIIYMGILCGTCALALDRYCSFYDYWQPPTIFNNFNFESFLYGFFFGGISTKIYELFFSKEYYAQKGPNPLLIVIIVFGSVFSYVVLLGLFHLNSVDIYVFILLTWVILFLLIDSGLYRICIWSGVIMIGINICWYTVVLLIYPSAIREIWMTNNLKGLFILNIPVEEHYFIFSLGCIGSIMYKVVTGSIKKRPYLTLSKRFKVLSRKSDLLINNNDARQSKPSMYILLEWVKPFSLPFLLLLLVIGRMVIFGDDRVPASRIFNLFR